jgi:hypothetical protein
MSAQSYSVSITSPSSSSIVSGSVIDNYQSSVSVSFTYSGQKSDPQNIWHIKVWRDFVVGIDNSNSLYKLGDNTMGTWIDEGSGSCDVPLIVGRANPIFIALYEGAPNTSQSQWTCRASGGSYYLRPAQKVYVENNFGSGNVNVNNNPNVSSGEEFNIYSSSLSLSAISNQTDSEGYNRIWNSNASNQSKWEKVLNGNQDLSTSSSCTYSSTEGENGITLMAGLRRQCHLTSNGSLAFSGNTSSPGSYVTLTEGVASTVTAQTYFVTSDYLVRQFTSWADNNSTANPRTFTISSHTTADVNSTVVKPDNGYKNMAYPGTAGDYITVSWSEHPSSSVSQYQIWRRVRHNGVTGSDVCIATVNRGTTSYTDYDYTYTASYTDDLLWYDVRAYYSPNSSYADAEFVAVYGKIEASKQSDDIAAAKYLEGLSIAPTEYSLGSYPNPFNPTTVIRYTMPEAGQVSLKVYNILSQEVANLVESNQPAGVHQVNFNASHLPTGIYIARLQAGAKVMTAKLQLVK